MGKKTVNPSIRLYINKTGNRTTLDVKTGYYLELLTPETMKLLGRQVKVEMVKMCLI